jgi:LuxR family maltose regulon positive regulatory protein
VQTSILDRLCEPLCDAVLEDRPASDSQSILRYLERANLFLVPLDDTRRWYRYHHLFANSLRAELDDAARATLHRRAAEWFAANDLTAEAVQHALAADDLAFAADIIERAVQKPATWSGGAVATLVRWLDALPDAVLRTRPALSLHASRSLYLAGRLADSEQLLDQAEQALQRDSDTGEEADQLLALAAVYRGAIAALRGEVQRAIAWGERALARLAEDNVHARARAFDTLGLAYELAGDMTYAGQMYVEASSLAQKAGVTYLAINARCESAMTQMALGQLTRAAQICREALHLAETPIPPLGLVWAILGEIAREQNDLSLAEQYLERGIALSQQGGITDDLRFEMVFLAWLRQAQGDTDGALKALERAETTIQMYDVARLTQLCAARRARLDLAQQNLASAGRWAGAYWEARQAHKVEYLREFEDLTLVRVFLATDQRQAALEILRDTLSRAEMSGRNRTVIEALILYALVLHARGEMAQALAALRQALALGEPEGFVRVFVDEGAPMVPLLLSAKKHGIAPAYVEGLLAALPQDLLAQATGVSLPPEQALVEPLSERELEALRLLAAGLKYREIADELVVSLSTVRYHVRNIYGKLGVHNRTEAIARARDMHLL